MNVISCIAKLIYTKHETSMVMNVQTQERLGRTLEILVFDRLFRIVR